VSEYYLTDLKTSPHVELVSVGDIVPERATTRAAQFDVPHVFASLDAMLAGPPFDLLINTTSMQSHADLNLKALKAGQHVLSEKPMAASREEAQQLLAAAEEHKVRLFAAPIVMTSPAFHCLADVISSGEIGMVHAAHGCYGHGGPSWGPWFYQKGGGSLFDLGVYNVTLLTGLLGPARSVMAQMGVVIPERDVEGQHIQVEADDNTMLLIDHGNSVFSCVQTGFAYSAHAHLHNEADSTVSFIGTKGYARLLGYDWEPRGVAVQSPQTQGWETRCEDQQGYNWERGGSYVAETLATGKDWGMRAEHAYHVLDVMLAAHESAAQGRRIEIASCFPWPLLERMKDEG
jgi:predicted dehydrogenase